MKDMVVDNIKRRFGLLAVAALALGCLAFATFVFYDRGNRKVSADPGIVVVSADGTLHSDHAPGGKADSAISQVPPPLTFESIKQVLNLPALQGVQGECGVDICSVTGQPRQATMAFDQEELERLLNQDIPSTLSKSGYELQEPVQIEEIGPDQYNLKFRVGLMKQS